MARNPGKENHKQGKGPQTSALSRLHVLIGAILCSPFLLPGCASFAPRAPVSPLFNGGLANHSRYPVRIIADTREAKAYFRFVVPGESTDPGIEDVDFVENPLTGVWMKINRALVPPRGYLDLTDEFINTQWPGLTPRTGKVWVEHLLSLQR